MAMAMITYRDLVLATADDVACRQWLRANRLLAANMLCHKCGSAMSEKTFSRVSEGLAWRCPNQRCRTVTTLRRGSFFEKSHLSLVKLVDLLYLWAMEVSVQEAVFQVGELLLLNSFHFTYSVYTLCI